MELCHFKQNLVKNNFSFVLEKAATMNEISNAENRLKVSFPEKVKQFYFTFNGLSVNSPELHVLPLNKLVANSGIVTFAIFKGTHKLGFEITELNHCDQWNIVNVDTNFLVTHSMSSFWANKIWAWLRSQRTIWQEETYC